MTIFGVGKDAVLIVKIFRGNFPSEKFFKENN